MGSPLQVLSLCELDGSALFPAGAPLTWPLRPGCCLQLLDWFREAATVACFALIVAGWGLPTWSLTGSACNLSLD